MGTYQPVVTASPPPTSAAIVPAPVPAASRALSRTWPRFAIAEPYRRSRSPGPCSTGGRPARAPWLGPDGCSRLPTSGFAQEDRTAVV